MASSPAEVFGDGSTVNPILAQSSEIPTVAHYEVSWQFGIYLLLALFLYFVVIYRYRSSIGIVFKSAFSMKKTTNSMEMQSSGMGSFLYYGVLLALLTISAVVTDIALQRAYLAPDQDYLIIGVSLGLLTIIILYRWIIIGTIKVMDNDKGIYKRLRSINRLSMTITAVIVTPPVMIAGLGGYALELALIPLGLLFLYHSVRLFKYFILSGFSILQWFLYLCTVEILPISLVLVLIMRYNGIN